MLREKMPHNLDFKCSEKALHLWIKMYLYSHLLNATVFFLTVFHDHVKTTSYKWFGVFCSVPPADRQLCEQIGHGHGSAAAVPGHPGVHGAQQSGSLPQGGTGDHHWTAHPASSGVRVGGGSVWTGFMFIDLFSHHKSLADRTKRWSLCSL